MEEVSIPFPTEYLQVEGAYETVMQISCDIDTLKQFYNSFTNVSTEGDSIVLTLDGETQIKITLQQGSVTFEKIE